MFWGLKKKFNTLFFMAIGAGILTTIYSTVLFLFVYKINKKVTMQMKRK